MELQENIDEGITVARISKMEEQEALQYIRKILIPLSVKWWNDRTSVHPLKADQISKNLKKVIDRRPPEPKNEYFPHMITDYIVYKAGILCKDLSFNNEISFEFPITKNSEGEVIVNFRSGLVDAGPFKVGENPLLVKEGSSIEPKQDYTVNKIEEAEALQFIRRVLIDKISKDYDFNADLVRKTLRKIRHYTTAGNIDIMYQAKSGREIPEVYFGIYKNDNGQLVVMVDHHYSFAKSYRVGDYFTGRTEKYVVEGSIPSELSKYAISKIEEDQAVDFIKKKLIPAIVDWMNDVSKHYTRHPIQTPQQVTKTVKKVDQHRHSIDGHIRELTYQALFLGEPFLFDIFKDDRGKLSVVQKSDGMIYTVK